MSVNNQQAYLLKESHQAFLLTGIDLFAPCYDEVDVICGIGDIQREGPVRTWLHVHFAS